MLPAQGLGHRCVVVVDCTVVLTEFRVERSAELIVGLALVLLLNCSWIVAVLIVASRHGAEQGHSLCS